MLNFKIGMASFFGKSRNAANYRIRRRFSVFTKKVSQISVGIPLEDNPCDRYIAMDPSRVKLLTKKGFTLKVEEHAGNISTFLNDKYNFPGSKICKEEEVYGSDIVLKANPPNLKYGKYFKPGSALFCEFQHNNVEIIRTLNGKGVSVYDINAFSGNIFNYMERLSLDLYNNNGIVMAIAAKVMQFLSRPFRFMSLNGESKPQIKVLFMGSVYNQELALQKLLKRLGAIVKVKTEGKDVYFKDFDVVFTPINLGKANLSFSEKDFSKMAENSLLVDFHKKVEKQFAKTVLGETKEIDGKFVMGIDINEDQHLGKNLTLFRGINNYLNIFESNKNSEIFELFEKSVKNSLITYSDSITMKDKESEAYMKKTTKKRTGPLFKFYYSMFAICIILMVYCLTIVDE